MHNGNYHQKMIHLVSRVFWHDENVQLLCILSYICNKNFNLKNLSMYIVIIYKL